MELLQNKTGSMYFSIIIALVLFMVGMVVVNILKPEVTTARLALDCAGTPATDGTKVLCLITDSVVPYFIILVLSIALGVITEKVLL